MSTIVRTPRQAQAGDAAVAPGGRHGARTAGTHFGAVLAGAVPEGVRSTGVAAGTLTGTLRRDGRLTYRLALREGDGRDLACELVFGMPGARGVRVMPLPLGRGATPERGAVMLSPEQGRRLLAGGVWARAWYRGEAAPAMRGRVRAGEEPPRGRPRDDGTGTSLHARPDATRDHTRGRPSRRAAEARDPGQGPQAERVGTIGR